MKEIIDLIINSLDKIALILAFVLLIQSNRRIDALEEKIRQMECISDLDNIARELNDRKKD